MLQQEVVNAEHVLRELILLMVQVHVLIAEQEDILQQEPVHVLIVLQVDGQMVLPLLLVRIIAKQDMLVEMELKPHVHQELILQPAQVVALLVQADIQIVQPVMLQDVILAEAHINC